VPYASISASSLHPTMPIPLSTADFKVTSATCELRYENAYLIYDRTGQVFHDSRGLYTNFRVVNATPNQTLFQADEGAFALELSQSRFSTTNPDPSLEKFATNCKRFFDAVTILLDIRVFTRVGLRVVFRKDFKEIDEAKAALHSLKLVNLKAEERFGAASQPNEVLLRWEGAQLGAMLRLKAESGKIDLVLPPELEAEKPEIHKSFNGLFLDIDYYTVAPVERSQFEASAWIPRSVRTIRKNIDTIFGN
jgi:hypothetical protein